MNPGDVRRVQVGRELSTVQHGGFGSETGHTRTRIDAVDELQLRGRQSDQATGIIRQRQSSQGAGFGNLPSGVVSGAFPGMMEPLHSGNLHQEARVGSIIKERAETETLPYQTRLSGPVQFLKKLLGTWSLDLTNAPVLLGMDPDDGLFAENLLNGRVPLRGRDAKDRIVHLYRIRKILSALFRDEQVENEWLREPHEMLNERSPMDLMLDGSMENLLLVKEYVEAAAGR